MGWLESNPIAGSLIGSAVSGASSLGAGIFNYLATKETNKANKELSELSYQQNIEQWNRENVYNHPASQMSRLAEAGLNPNLVYGNGSAVQTSAHSPRMDYPNMQAPNLEFQLSNFIADALNAKLKVAEIQNVESDTNIKNIQASGLETQNAIGLLNLAMKRIEEAGYQDFYDKTVKKLGGDIDLQESTIKLHDAQISELEAQANERSEAAEQRRRDNEFWEQHPELFTVKQILNVVEPILPGITDLIRYFLSNSGDKKAGNKRVTEYRDSEGNVSSWKFDYIEDK